MGETTETHHRPILNRCLLLGVALVVICSAALAQGCEPWDVVEYSNETEHRVSVYKGGEFQFKLGAGETRRFNVTEEVWLNEVRIVTDDGEVVFQDDITWDELREMSFRIVIS